MHLMKWGLKPRSRKYIACLVALIVSLGIIGLGNPGTALAKSSDSPPAESLVVNINDNGEIIPVHTYTMAEMQALSGGAVYYSSIDSMPAPVITIAQGVTLNNLVADINANYNANVTMGSSTLKSIKLYSTDDWSVDYTYDYLFGATRYYYPRLVETWDGTNNRPGDGGTDNPSAVDPLFALSSYQQRNLTNLDASQMVGPGDPGSTTFRFSFGQTADDMANNTVTTGRFAKWVNRIDINLPDGPDAPTLISDSTDNTIGNPIDITFTDNEAWRDAVNIVRVDGVDLTPDQYTRTEGKITINGTVFTEAKDYTVYVKASKYKAATVTQTVQAPQAEIVFTINGDAVAASTYTMADLQAMNATEGVYPAKSGTVTCKGVALKDLLTLLNITDGSLIAQINITDAATYPIDPVTVADLLNPDNAYLLTYLIDGGAVTGETPLRIYKAADSPKTATIKNVFGITINHPANSNNPPALTADSTDNIVGNPIDITFTDDEVWRNAITEVKVDDTVLDGSKYTKAGGVITLDASVFTAAGTFIITVKAAGYQDAVVTQTIANNDQATTALIITVDNAAPIAVTADQIKALNPNNTLRHYSFAKDGKMNYYTGLGAPLAAILSQYASLNSNEVQIMTVKAADYYRTFEDPQNELFNTRYYYPAVGDAAPVDTIIATDAQDYFTDDIGKLDNANTMRLLMGQASADERTNSWMVKWVNEIDITTFAATNVPVDGVLLNKEETTLVIANSEQLIATVTPANATNKTVSWKSDKDEVATVDNTGKVCAVGEGQAVITVTTADGNFTASCTVTVLLEAPPAVYTLMPVEDDAYTKGTTPDGIWTMTVNPGNSGLKYFSVLITPVVAHDGKETMVFTHLRDGAQLELNATEADFDVVNSAQAGFNVQAGDVIKVYPVDRLSNDGTNPFILQQLNP